MSEQYFPSFAESTPPRYCMRCQEALIGGDRCPRCQLPFNPDDAATFRKTRTFIASKFWTPGITLMAIAGGVSSYAVILNSGEMGAALFIAVPISIGAIIGYAVRARAWVALVLTLIATMSVVMMLVSLQLAGFFCGLTLSVIFLGPAMIGALLGWLLKISLKASAWDQRSYLPIIPLLLMPYAAEFVENAIPRSVITSTVETELTVHATADEAWKSLEFYERVTRKPPWLLRFSLPKPTGSVGRRDQVGEVVRCLYDRGHITKQITEVIPGQKLAFKIIEQNLQVEHDVRMLDGSFELFPAGDGRTRIVLRTHYEKLLRPEWMWGPIERAVIHTLHRHVLEDIADQAEGRQTDRSSPVPSHDREASKDSLESRPGV